MARYEKRTEILGYVIGESSRAILFQGHFWHHPEWIPKSQSFIYRGWDALDETRITLSGWLSRQNDFQENQMRTDPPDW